MTSNSYVPTPLKISTPVYAYTIILFDQAFSSQKGVVWQGDPSPLPGKPPLVERCLYAQGLAASLDVIGTGVVYYFV